MIGASVIIATLAVLARLVVPALPPMPRWRRDVRPFGCARCDLTFTDARQVAWHGSQHPETYQ